MVPHVKCLICLDEGEKTCQFVKEGRFAMQKQVIPFKHLNCLMCGQYFVSEQGEEQLLIQNRNYPQSIRSAVSHNLKSNSRSGLRHYIVGDDEGTRNLQRQSTLVFSIITVTQLFNEVRIPDFYIQVYSILKFIGETVRRTGKGLSKLPIDFHTIVGTKSRSYCERLVKKLKGKGLVDFEGDFKDLILTDSGWEFIGE